jgi:streptomycin 6-kinase
MSALWRPLSPDHAFLPVQRWADGLSLLRKRFDGGTGPLPATPVQKAERLFAELFASSTETVLLHGDLHHYNILRDGEEWRVIDPKGVAGEPAYECGAWLRNPSDLLFRPNVRELLERRIAIFSEMLDIERDRIREWAYAQSVLSAWWSVEDNTDGWEDSFALAEYLAS